VTKLLMMMAARIMHVAMGQAKINEVRNRD
jgi:hypothetical protein